MITPTRRHLTNALLVMLLATLPLGCASRAGTGELSPAEITWYRNALIEMMEDDQRHRAALTWGTTDADELARLEALPAEQQLEAMANQQRNGPFLDDNVRASLEQQQQRIDSHNVRRLADLLEQYGWPDEARLGADVVDPTPILIHMPMEDVPVILPVLRHEVLAGKMPPKRYAVVVDRKRQHDGDVQLYGTSRPFIAATGTVGPPIIEDIDVTNAARAEIGLPPLEEYTIATP